MKSSPAYPYAAHVCIETQLTSSKRTGYHQLHSINQTAVKDFLQSYLHIASDRFVIYDRVDAEVILIALAVFFVQISKKQIKANKQQNVLI